MKSNHDSGANNSWLYLGYILEDMARNNNSSAEFAEFLQSIALAIREGRVQIVPRVV